MPGSSPAPDAVTDAVPDAASNAVTESAPLAEVTRGGFVESRHAGSVLVLGADGTPVFALGNPAAPVFPRSALKPFQAMAVLTSGVELEGAQAAIATSSHSGSEAHVALVRELLQRAGLSEDALQCPRDMPHDRSMRELVMRRDEGPARIYHCCSGKHAAMLLACVQNDWPVENYLGPEHPLQRKIVDTVERLAGEKVTISAVDGCGAPVHALSLAGLAKGIRAISTAAASSPFALYRAGAALSSGMLTFPWAVGAAGEPDTVIMQRLGCVAKSGYEGVFVIGMPTGETAVVKIMDGSLRAAPLVALQALVHAGALAPSQLEDVIPQLGLATYGGGVPVGVIRAVF
jgi:L-asparaginase II